MRHDRHIQIGRDALGNTLITGNENTVIQIVIPTLRGVELEPTPIPSPVVGNPYQGLSAFTESDAHRFFGREQLTQKLWGTFRGLHEPPPGGLSPLRLLPILGPSGSGKSSLARAGLIPELAHRPLPGLRIARVAVVLPGAHPLEALAGMLARIATNDPTPVAKAHEFIGELKRCNAHGEYDGLRRVAELLPGITDSQLILLIDQCEELYSLCEDTGERDAFVGNLFHAAADRAAHVSIILTLRSDFLGHTQRHPTLNHAIAAQGVVIPIMSKEELRRAIAEPAARAGHPLDAAMVDNLISETWGRDGALPLLQFALTRIWEGMTVGVDPPDTLRRLGGVGGALAVEAQGLYETLSETDKAVVRRAFLRLVHLGEGAGDTRRRIKVSELVAHGEDPDHVREVLRFFARPDARLITLAANPDGTDTAEVTHEALFEHWESLKIWLETSRDDLRFHRRLAEAAHHWEAKGHPQGLLWRLPDLDLLRAFQKRAGSDMTAIQIAFFWASERCAQHTRWMTRLAVALPIILALVAVYAAYLARDRERLALARQLAAQAELVRSQRADLLPRSVLLAAESMKRYPSLEGDQVLRPGLALLPRPLTSIVHEGNTRALAFSPDGKWLATGSSDKTARVWEVATGREIVRIRHAIDVQALAFSADGRLLMTADQDDVRVWKADTGAQMAHRRQQSRPTAIVLSLEGEWLATQGYGRTARVWEPRTGRELLSVPFDDSIEAAAFSPDGRYLAAAGFQRTRVWEILSGKEMPPIYLGGRWGFTFSPSGQWLAMGTSDRTVRVWQVDNGSEVRQMRCEGCENYAGAIAFSPDSRWLAIYADRSLQVREVWTNKEVARVVPGVGPVAFSPNGRLLTTWTGENTITIWEITPEPEMAQLAREVTSEPEINERIGASAVAFDSDGTWMASGRGEHTVQVWEATTGRTLAQVEHRGPSELPVALSVNGQWLATFDENGTVQVWEVATGQQIPNLAPEDPVQAISFSPDGTRLAVASGNRVQVREVKTGQLVAELPHAGQVWAIALSPNGRQLATASDERTVQVWEVTTKREVASLEHEKRVMAMAFAPNGQRLTTGSADHIVRVWNVTTGRVVARMAHEGEVSAVGFSSDGNWVATGSADRTARLWEAGTGRALARMEHESVVDAVAVSPDGKWLVTASGGRGWRWLLRPQALIAEACARLTRNLTLQEWQQYLGEEPYRKTCPALP
jgi:WD40 repeat protein